MRICRWIGVEVVMRKWGKGSSFAVLEEGERRT